MPTKPKKDPEPEAPEVEEVAAEEAPSAPPEIPSVVVQRNVDESGILSVEVAGVGGVQATEIQTILELGIKRVRQLLGLPTLD